MAVFSGNMLAIAIDLAAGQPAYEDIAGKFFAHFLYIAKAINEIGGDGLWDDATVLLRLSARRRPRAGAAARSLARRARFRSSRAKSQKVTFWIACQRLQNKFAGSYGIVPTLPSRSPTWSEAGSTSGTCWHWPTPTKWSEFCSGCSPRTSFSVRSESAPFRGCTSTVRSY